tara:strand:- start:281 stop:556 length:276 start_codon:yes stop_codon:yes gene_type:complete
MNDRTHESKQATISELSFFDGCNDEYGWRRVKSTVAECRKETTLAAISNGLPSDTGMVQGHACGRFFVVYLAGEAVGDWLRHNGGWIFVRS